MCTAATAVAAGAHSLSPSTVPEYAPIRPCEGVYGHCRCVAVRKSPYLCVSVVRAP